MEDSISKQHFKNLLSIAFADGILDKAELDFIFKKSGKYYLLTEDIEGIVRNVIHPTPLKIEDSERRSAMMLDLIEMMFLDSEISEAQLRQCSIFGVSMGFSNEDIENIVSQSVQKLEAGESQEVVQKFIQSFH
ncbi:MAG: hypothetical protein ACPGRC_01250 [Salibacteraceae bacterium]